MTVTRRRTKPLKVTVEHPATLPHSALLIGPVRAIQPALRDAACPWQYDAMRHAFKVPRDKRLDDVLAQLELAGHHVEVPMPGWS
jgi:hypothetical protein